MSIYRVVYEGNDLWIPGTEDVIDPVVEIELNTAGRLTMELLPNHPDFHTLLPLRGTVEVLENGEVIWFGRPVYVERTMQNHKPIYCEGALAYFNDSAQRPREKGPTTAAALFSDILSVHNAQVPANRQFSVGTVTASGSITWENDYENTLPALQALVEQAGGYLIPRRENGTNYLDYLGSLPQDDSQPIQFSLNMTDFDRRYSFEEKFTAVLPIGGVPEETEQVPNPPPVTIASVNDGSDILDGADVSTYGRIVRVLKFPNSTDPAELLSLAQRVLTGVDFDPISIQASAVDLSLLDGNYGKFKVGKKYRVVSAAHDVDAWLPLRHLSIRLDRAKREISLGTVACKGYTDLLQSLTEQLDVVKKTVLPKTGGGRWSSPGTVQADGWKHWVGTEASYAAMQSHDSKTIYFTYED